VSNPILDAMRIGRASGAKTPKLQELHNFAAAARTLASARFAYDTQIHRAHVLILAKQRILSGTEAATILKGLEKVDELAAADASLRSYLPYEAALRAMIGNVGGKMHIGRSRNELANAGNRMFLRDQLMRIVGAVLDLREVVVNKAADHLETLTVVNTQRKEAHTITAYLMAISEDLSENLDLYRQLYPRINQCPLGAAATAGSDWTLDRDITARLLGFEGLVANSIEGVANCDHIAEFAFANAVFLAGVSRLALEIQRWSTDEYQILELDSPPTNSIKPQKENQDALECGRKVALATMGPWVSILTSLKGREYQYSSARFEPDPRSIDAMIAATHMMTDLVRSLQLNREQMSGEAAEKIATMTDLIDMLVRRRSNDLALVQEAVVAQTGQEISDTAHDIAHALDPMRNIRRFDGKRMPAPESIQASVNDAREAIKCDRAWLNDTIVALAVAERELQLAVEGIIG